MKDRTEDPRVQALLDAARALPREIEPPPEVWTGVRARLAGHAAPPAPRRRWWHSGRLAAAAALVLVGGTATFTWRAADRGAATKAEAPVALQLLPVDRQFAETLAELHAALEQQRALLPAAAVNVIEQSLAVIDAAIAETRYVLARDPRDAVAADLLAAHYRRKVELLRRAAQIPTAL